MGLKSFVPFISIFNATEKRSFGSFVDIGFITKIRNRRNQSVSLVCAQGELLRDANSIRTLFCFVWHISQLLLLLLLLDCELYVEMKYYHSHNIHFLVMSYINR